MMPVRAGGGYDMDEQPKYLMRFIGFKENGSGELKPTSPGGFKQHELRELAFDYSLSPWWELVDDVPDLVVPEEDPEDSVYIEKTLVPVDAVDTAPPSEDEDKSLYVDGKTDLPPYVEEKTEETSPIKLVLPIEGDPEEVDVIHYDGMTVKSLKLFIEQRGGEVDSDWLKADLIREARILEEASRAASESS